MKARRRDGGDDRERDHEVRLEPVVFLSLVEKNLESTDAQREKADSPVVDPGRTTSDVRRIEDKQVGHDERQDAHGNVDVEDEAPAVAVGEPPSQHGTENGRDDDAEAPESHRAPALLGGKGFEQHRLRDRLQRASGHPLDHAEDDEHRERRRETAEERRDGEPAYREHQQAFASELIREPSRHRKNDRVGDEIRRERPGRLVDGRGEASGDVWKRDVDDGGVEHLHEGRRHHRDGDDPGVDFGNGWRVHGRESGRHS